MITPKYPIVMKKVILLLIAALALPIAADAQLGGLLEKAAKKAATKTAEKVVDKAVDRASDAAANAIDKEVDKRLPNEKETQAAPVAEATYASLMGQLPELPSVDQMVKHKEAELNEKALKLMTSKVTAFSAKALDLASQCAALRYNTMDSAQITDAAYRYAELSTGLSREELEKLSTMSEAEQEAYLQAHYATGRAETALARQAVDASQWLEPLQPMIDKWTAAGEKADKAYDEMAVKLRPIYAKYASRLAQATGAERNNVLLGYYTEAAPYIRTAVQKALNTRLNEQLPLAEKIEAEMVKVRASHPDAVNQLLNYPQLTATQYFTEVSRLLEIPEYSE